MHVVCVLQIRTQIFLLTKVRPCNFIYTSNQGTVGITSQNDCLENETKLIYDQIKYSNLSYIYFLNMISFNSLNFNFILKKNKLI